MSDRHLDKLLVFIVAYNAEKTLAPVLDRIPASLLEGGCGILVIDDASQDETFRVGLEYKRTHPGIRLEVLRNCMNVGYGGNQKIGYTYALRNDYDVVALIHGDGQYPPEFVEDLSKPIFAGEADAVLGSRMLKRKDALRGGMPLYKFLGNIILTKLQNWLLKTGFSEFHTGFRIYSTKALASIPFERNSNDFHFDTEIIIQLLLKGLRIAELPIPTHYGDEVCHVNGMKYALDVVLTTLSSKLHQASIAYDRKYEIVSEPDYSLKLSYPSSHTMALEAVPSDSTVLDIGCGQGLIARELAKKGCRVTGLDSTINDRDEEGITLRRADLNATPLPLPATSYDCILLLDVVEHLASPEKFFDDLRSSLHGMEKPRIIITVPNVAFFIIRLRMLLGSFNYGKVGILDFTHTRLFTLASLKTMLQQRGYSVEAVRGIPAPYPKAIGDNATSRLLLRLNSLFIRLRLPLFSYQLYVEARPLPTIDDLLDGAHTRMTCPGKDA
ncbi:bifunctional glycosyltransferase/class I SAM-dependent methyltransferase [Desulfovibrio aminophilus]|uniref:bifunctional glycosyltransferase/class I SAM-dependent methyltransferase n=1 Tax=Desulfovibrio aminophilus TaxID=81425 RepID=UPI0004229576|nr:bifunctional glycosyltransferase/class I SAM-dependent methyltransferase [Desulfovibrio aminophilus]